MIAYAACVGDPEKFRGICLPGLQRVAAPEDLLIEAEHERSIFAAYNEVLDAVRDRDDLEALVLLHEDTELLDPKFCDLVRRHVAEPDVAIVGAVGARAVQGLSWWEAECYGTVLETRGVIDFGGGTHDVDTVDGLVMALSPWAVRNLRFDEDAYSGFDAYDADFCAQARAVGKRVVVTELPVAHRHNRTGARRASSDGGSFERNEAIFRAKWLESPAAEETEKVSAAGAGVRDAHGEDGYFEHTRPELRALVPAGAGRVLDVGCGAGSLGAALKADRGCEVVGLEGFPEAAERARKRLDDVHCVDLDALEALPPEAGSFDAMIFGDVLEHLRDPARLLRALLPSLSDDGVIVCSIPNVKHWTVLYPLLVQDRWTYSDAGLLDRTHVHFFTLDEISDMLDRLGLECVHLGVNDLAPLPPTLAPLADLAERFGAERAEAEGRLGAYQYLVVARPNGKPAPAAPAAPAPAPAARPSGVRDAAGDDGYYEATREDLRELIPAGARRVLDVGCGVGRTGEALKADRGCEVVGLEGFPDAAAQARERLDDVLCLDLDALEALPAAAGTFDAMLFGDVLEHLRDPARLLKALLPSLADDGVLICSIPNVKHWSVLFPLLAHDRFTYADAGLLDRTHVHFFTLAEIGDMLEEIGLEGVQVVPKDFAPLPPKLEPLADFAEACGGEREETRLRLGAYQYLVVAKRP